MKGDCGHVETGIDTLGRGAVREEGKEGGRREGKGDYMGNGGRREDRKKRRWWLDEKRNEGEEDTEKGSKG